jgi:hypothetical protein
MHQERIARGALACAALIALAAPAAPALADDAPLSGFTTYGSGELDGIVTTADGKPAAGVTVYIAPAAGAQQQVVTDAHGRYRAVLKDGGAYTMVFVEGALRVGGQISVPTRVDGGEAIEIHEAVAPAVIPRPLAPTWRVPAYSEAAMGRGVWARAWLMLDVDARGDVARLKLLTRPGHDLDPIAIREAFELRFKPALDRSGRPTSALVLWSYEWPSYWWMTERRYPPGRMPAEVAKIPCKGTGGTFRYYRDCAKPELARGMAEPWIARPRK